MKTLKPKFENAVRSLLVGPVYDGLDPKEFTTLLKAAQWGDDEGGGRRRLYEGDESFVRNLMDTFGPSVAFFLRHIGAIYLETTLAGFRRSSGVDGAFVRAHTVAAGRHRDRLPEICRLLEDLADTMRRKGKIHEPDLREFLFSVKFNGKGDEWWDTRSGPKNGPLFRETYRILQAIFAQYDLVI